MCINQKLVNCRSTVDLNADQVSISVNQGVDGMLNGVSIECRLKVSIEGLSIGTQL